MLEYSVALQTRARIYFFVTLCSIPSPSAQICCVNALIALISSTNRTLHVYELKFYLGGRQLAAFILFLATEIVLGLAKLDSKKEDAS